MLTRVFLLGKYIIILNEFELQPQGQARASE